MQFSSSIIALAFAASSVVAAPNAPKTTTTSSAKAGATPAPSVSTNFAPSSNTVVRDTNKEIIQQCGNGTTQLCCDTSLNLVGLTCVLSGLLGSTCSTQTICCVNNGGVRTIFFSNQKGDRIEV